MFPMTRRPGVRNNVTVVSARHSTPDDEPRRDPDSPTIRRALAAAATGGRGSRGQARALRRPPPPSRPQRPERRSARSRSGCSRPGTQTRDSREWCERRRSRGCPRAPARGRTPAHRSRRRRTAGSGRSSQRVAPCGRTSSISLRRDGTVTSIALSANMKPTKALIPENNASLLLSGATATANSRESNWPGTRFTFHARGEPRERRTHFVRARRVVAYEDPADLTLRAGQALRVADRRRPRPGCGPARRCRLPEAWRQPTFPRTRAPICSLTGTSGPAPISRASGAGSAIACWAASCLAEKRRSSGPLARTEWGSTPIRSTDRSPPGPITFTCRSNTGRRPARQADAGLLPATVPGNLRVPWRRAAPARCRRAGC